MLYTAFVFRASFFTHIVRVWFSLTNITHPTIFIFICCVFVVSLFFITELFKYNKNFLDPQHSFNKMVTAYNSERYLAFLYTTGGVASLIQIICTAIVWLHWRVVLNTCAGNFQSYTSYYDERDCGCILYGRDTLSYFVGSHVGYCYWATFGLVIPLIFSFIFGCYHVYRVCCRSNKPRQGKMHVHQRSTEVIQLTVEQEMGQEDDVSPYFWTPAMIIGIIIAIYSLVHAILMLDGFLSTCKQYRNRVLKHINAIGRAVSWQKF